MRSRGVRRRHGVGGDAACARQRGCCSPTSWPHFALTGVLSFIVVHSLARSYDLTGAVHASLFDFVIKPAVLTCAAMTFSYGVEAWIRHSTIDGAAAFGLGQLSPEHYVIVFATLAMAGERLLGFGLLNRWQAAGHLSTSVVVFGADAIGQRLVKVVREDYAELGFGGRHLRRPRAARARPRAGHPGRWRHRCADRVRQVHAGGRQGPDRPAHERGRAHPAAADQAAQPGGRRGAGAGFRRHAPRQADRARRHAADPQRPAQAAIRARLAGEAQLRFRRPRSGC